MKEIFEKILFVIKDKVLRRKILFIFLMFLIFRLFATIPLPMVDLDALNAFFDTNQFLGMLQIFSAGGLSALSIVMLGVMPYITASIIMQVAAVIFPKIKEMQSEEGEKGRKKISNYSRLLSVPLAAIQSFGFLSLIKSAGLLEQMTSTQMMLAVVITVAGSLMVMWIGELISEFGIGNGISLIIFAGIVAILPGTLRELYSNLSLDPSQIPTYVGVFIMFVVMVYAIVFMTEAERPVPVNNTRMAKAGGKAQNITSSIPIKLNQAGVIPIIFAISLISFPAMIFGFMGTVKTIEPGSWMEKAANFSQEPLSYGLVYFALVFFFTYFYTAVTFDPKKMADNLQKGGNFVPGVRPGEDTEDYFAKITTRVTFLGATFLSLIAVLPIVIAEVTGIDSLAIGGTSILIVVSVGIDLIRKVSAQVSVREYIKSF